MESGQQSESKSVGVQGCGSEFQRRSWTAVRVKPQTKVADISACSHCECRCVMEMLMERIMIQCDPCCHHRAHHTPVLFSTAATILSVNRHRKARPLLHV